MARAVQRPWNAAAEATRGQVLATFWHGGLKHVVAAPMEPVFVIGAPVPPNEVCDSADKLSSGDLMGWWWWEVTI